MSRDQIRVLMVEDSPDDAELVQLELKNAGYEVSALRVVTDAAMQEALATQEWDVIIADYFVPGFGALPALAVLKQSGLDIPFIVVSGTVGDEPAVAAMRAGAHDYVLKENLARLAPAVEREIQEAAVRQQKRDMEVELRESEARFRSMYEHAAVGIKQVALDGRLLMVNDALCRILNYSQSELLEMTVESLTHPEDRARETTLFESMMRGERSAYEREKRCLRRDGSLVWVNVTSSLVRDTSGKILYRIAIVQDITARKQAEEALVRNEKLAAAGRLAATIAHEIRNPLEAMTNILYLLAPSLTDQNSKEYLNLIEHQVHAISRIATQTLKFQRDSKPSEFDLSELVSEVVAFYKSVAQKRGVKLAERLLPKATIVASSSEIRQALSNLVLNAIDATSNGGQVTVHLRTGSDWRNSAIRGFRVTVCDTGTGIARDVKAQLFQPFFTTKGDNGTGLGLWVTKGIVEGNGGHICLWSSRQPGRSGTFFSVFLPEAVAGEDDRQLSQSAVISSSSPS